MPSIRPETTRPKAHYLRKIEPPNSNNNETPPPHNNRSRGAGGVLKPYENLQSKLPVLPFEQQIGFGPVGHLHLLGIPLQTLAGKLAGDHTEA